MTEPASNSGIDSATRRAVELVEAHEALTRSVARLSSHAELPGLLTTVLQEIVRASGAVSVAVFAYDPARDVLFNYAQILRGEVIDLKTDPRMTVFANPTPATGNPAWEAMVQQRYFWVDFNQPDERAGRRSSAWHREHRHGYVVCIPMMNGPHPVGFLGLAFDQSEVVRPTELRLERSRVLAQQAALAMQLTRLSDEDKASALAEERLRSDSAKHAALLEERNRMAREIHDTLAQSFTGVMMQLRAAQSAIHSRPGPNLALLDSCLSRAESLAREGLRDARRSVMALRPEAAEFADLPAKARWLIEQSTGGTSVRGRVEIDGDARPVPPDLGFHLFRIAQEAVANALRHAEPASLLVRLSYGPDTLTLAIVDDGHGFDPAAEIIGSGLVGMRHRASQINADFAVETAPTGTSVRVHAPFAP